MDARQERGLVIAATAKIVNRGKVWLVPSQAGSGKKYTVCPDPENPFCSCPDHEDHGGKCKHIYAVEYVARREQGDNGEVIETRTVTFTEKKTYSQNWPAYNLAQTTEKHRFQELLCDLARTIIEPPQPKYGRPRALVCDQIFMACLKVYLTTSSRRYACDLMDAFKAGYLTERIHPMSVCAFLESETLTPVLQDLITRSAAPLRVVEKDFAVDSSGFSSNRFVRWYDHKYGCERFEHKWVKMHLCCGVKTNIVSAVRVLEEHSADCPQFAPLVEELLARLPSRRCRRTRLICRWATSKRSSPSAGRHTSPSSPTAPGRWAVCSARCSTTTRPTERSTWRTITSGAMSSPRYP